jgi:hypothetical protein
MEPQKTLYREENYWFTTGWSAVVAAIGGVANGQILLSGDAPFKCYYITLHVRQGGLIVANFGGDVQINEAQTGKNLSPIAIPTDALSGNGNLPYILPVPRIFSGNTTILFTFTAILATATQFNCTLHGTKLYRYTA